MKFKMIRKTLQYSRKQGSLKRRDKHIKHEDHFDYVYLTDIPSSIELDDVDDAFDCFCRMIFAKIREEDCYSTDDYFSEIQLLLDDTTDFWTFRFRFDNFILDKEYEIDTECV